MALFLSLWIKLFFVLTPFFGLTMFLSMTEGYDEHRRRKLALAVSAAVAMLCLILFFAGRQIFSLFGITLDSFRIGAGVLLMLSGIALVQGRAGAADAAREGDVAVVPLAMPIIVGPATTGTLLVMGAELNTVAAKAVGSLALFAAVLCMAAVLLAGSFFQRLMGVRGIAVLSKLTGLILAALAAQMIMTGIQGFIGVQP
ncbi:MAG: MarC family protein [Gammaproteobacteria bacterium]|nr:MarC family protein [Gammaproteobacteria bacterium]